MLMRNFMKKKIAIIDHVGQKAGMQYYSGALAKAMQQEQAEVLLFSNFTLEGIRSFSFFQKEKTSLLQSIKNQIMPFKKAARICKKEKVEALIIHLFSYRLQDYIALKILKKAKISIWAIVHDVEDLGQAKEKYQQKILYKYCDRIIVHNAFSKQALQHKFPDLAIKIIPHGNFHHLPKAISHEYSLEKWKILDGKYLLFFGQIKKVKGLDILIQAMQELDENIHLIIAGKNRDGAIDYYQQLIASSHLQHRFSFFNRFISDVERNELFQICDVLILPYKKIFQSGVMQMAISYKIPIIASSLQAFKEIIGDDENGWIFESENAKDLAKKINMLFEDYTIAEQKAEKAYAYSQAHFNWNLIAKKFILER